MLRALSALVFAASAVATGCATTTPNLDAKFGHSVTAARALQTINPDASRNTDPVAGIDAESAGHAIDRYHDSFKAPPATFSVISIGEGISSGGGQ
ncbi:hypothetical protein AZOA_27320 [Azoarcus sp. Aa7]|nr:hypothetical protein [Azoarcus sp. Aa7]